MSLDQLEKLLNKDNDNSLSLITEQQAIPPHSYPRLILIFWGIVSCVFVINLFLLCVRQAPLHLQALNKINTINRLIANKKYFEALKLHKELCKSYPQKYINSYVVEIVKACFECSQYNQSFFKEGIHYLNGKRLNNAEFAVLYQKVPLQLKDTYCKLFDILYREKNHEKEYLYILNNDRIKLL